MGKNNSSADNNGIVPVILSGGSGSRLWPISRSMYPKQLQSLTSDKSMIAETAKRLGPNFGYERPLVICNQDYRHIIAEQLRGVEIQPRAIVLEPIGRNTAPAAALAALILSDDDSDVVLAVLPADHAILDAAGFRDRIAQASSLAAEGYLVTLGVRPTSAQSGYGYIERGEDLEGSSGSRVARFTEKPNTDTAKRFASDGIHLWNSGMFVFRPDKYLEELEHYAPGIVEACRRSLEAGSQDMDFLRLGAVEFAAAPSISIDFAVMEHTNCAAVIPADFGWSDVGSWSSVWEISDKDESGNVLHGNVITNDVTNSYIRAENSLVAAIGIDDVTIVETDDAVLVAGKGHSERVKDLVEQLKAEDRPEHYHHVHNYRPWGYYHTIELGHRYQVKHLMIKPGHKLSLQLHHHRAEHWVVVSGAAQVTRGDDVFMLVENESTYIPIGVEHCIENLGKVPLDIIEVQLGAYLGEDDIVRTAVRESSM